jgi:hypothetical protein
VRLWHAAEATPEKGTGTPSGQNITQGSWQGGNRKFEAKYSGTFARSAFIDGTQTGSDGDKTISRAYSETIKRPLRIFLPHERK